MFAHGELYRGNGPLNAPIERWLEEHDAAGLPSDAPILFATVSVLDYKAEWQFLQSVHERKGLFHGLNATKAISFVDGIVVAFVETFPECERTVILLSDGGSMLLVKEERGSPNVDACFGEPTRKHTYRDDASVSLPMLDLEQKKT